MSMTTKENCLSFKGKQNLSVIDSLNDRYRNLNLNQKHQNISLEAVHLNNFSNKSKKVQKYAYENSVEAAAAMSDSFEGINGCKEDKSLKNVKSMAISSAFNNPFEFPRHLTDESTDPAIMQFSASQQLLNPNQSGSSNNTQKEHPIEGSVIGLNDNGSAVRQTQSSTVQSPALINQGAESKAMSSCINTLPTIGPPPEKKLKSEIDCEQCGLVKSKYTCPKCSFRTCSLPCVKLHKEANNCDGQRKPFDIVKKFSQFDDGISVKDQEYLNTLKSAVSVGIRSTNNVVKLAKPEAEDLLRKRPYPDESQIVKTEEESFVQSDPNETAETFMTSVNTGNETSLNESIRSEEVEENEFLKKHGNGPSDPNSLTHIERYLISGAVRRRIFITVNSPAEADGSRHEQHSDTIIWTTGVKFVREIPKKEDAEEMTTEFEVDDVGEEFVQVNGYTTSKHNSIVEYDCIARSIPENLTVNTLIRQFVKPKQFGTVVSKKDLDEEKMQAFWDAGLDQVLVYMKVPVGEKERYYMVDKSKSILDNLRNRYIIGYPKFIVILPNQFQQWQTLSEMEAQELHDERREQNKVRHQNGGGGGNRGRGNFNRRGGRGGNNFGGGGFRGGRGGGGNRGGRGFRGGHRNGGGQNRELASRDLSDIFEPFPSPANARISRPNYSSNSNDIALNGWASAVNRRTSNN